MFNIIELKIVKTDENTENKLIQNCKDNKIVTQGYNPILLFFKNKYKIENK